MVARLSTELHLIEEQCNIFIPYKSHVEIKGNSRFLQKKGDFYISQDKLSLLNLEFTQNWT